MKKVRNRLKQLLTFNDPLKGVAAYALLLFVAAAAVIGLGDLKPRQALFGPDAAQAAPVLTLSGCGPFQIDLANVATATPKSATATHLDGTALTLASMNHVTNWVVAHDASSGGVKCSFCRTATATTCNTEGVYPATNATWTAQAVTPWSNSTNDVIFRTDAVAPRKLVAACIAQSDATTNVTIIGTACAAN